MLKKVKIPLGQIKRCAGKWVVIDPRKDLIIAVGDTLKDISQMVTRKAREETQPGKLPYSFLVPRKGEGPYVL